MANKCKNTGNNDVEEVCVSIGAKQLLFPDEQKLFPCQQPLPPVHTLVASNASPGRFFLSFV